MTEENIKTEARNILETLASMPFDDCLPLLRTFQAFPPRPGLYAIRHRVEGILYIGKSLHIRNRFMGGHKALYMSYVDRLDPDDVRIAVVPLTYEQRLCLLDLEATMIQIVKPRYNSVIRQSED
jgi:excinuclease UvrABC nuclease subunit